MKDLRAILTVDWSPDGAYIAVGMTGGYLGLYKWLSKEAEELWTTKVANEGIMSIRFHPKRTNLMVIGSWDKRVYLIDTYGSKLWDVDLGNPISSGALVLMVNI